MLDQFVSLSEAEMVDVIGGGGISDLVVRVLTWIGDQQVSPSGEYADIMHGAR